MKLCLRRLLRDEVGTSAVEYGIICAMIVLAMLAALKGMSSENNSLWTNFTDKSSEAIAKANSGVR